MQLEAMESGEPTRQLALSDDLELDRRRVLAATPGSARSEPHSASGNSLHRNTEVQFAIKIEQIALFEHGPEHGSLELLEEAGDAARIALAQPSVWVEPP